MKYCADCEKENADEATNCRECGSSDLRPIGPRFHDSDFDPLKSEELGYEWVNLMRCRNVVEADTVAMTLRAAGIPVFIPDEFAMQVFTGFYAPALGHVRVQVPPSKHDEARQILMEPAVQDDGSNGPVNLRRIGKGGLALHRRAIYARAMRVRLSFLLAIVLSAWCVAAAEPAKGKDEAKDASAAKELFNGKDLSGWKKTEFGGEGETEVKDGKIIVHEGASLSGVHYTNAAPARKDYQISLEAMKIQGDDFFCGLTFPVNDTQCSLIVGGWGGGVVGLSSIDGMDASENDTTKYIKFDKDKWYKIKVEVRPTRIKAWIDNDQVVDADITDHKIDVRPGGIELQNPLGLCTYQTTAAWRNIRFTPLPPAKPTKP